MDAALFHKFREFAQARAGISLPEGREARIMARVDRRVRELGLSEGTEYLRLLECDSSGEEFVRFLEILTTHRPHFFHGSEHLAALGETIRCWYDAGQRRFRLWSAAAGRGEEPFSIAITVLEALAGREADVRILATDLSTRKLRNASEGVFEEPEVSAVAPELRRRYFEKVGGGSKQEPLWRISREVRDLVVFKRLNLASTPFPMRGPLDVVFCRDVLTYFDRTTRQALATELDRLLRPAGLLFVGADEQPLTGIRSALVVDRPSVYRRETESPVRVGAPV